MGIIPSPSGGTTTPAPQPRLARMLNEPQFRFFAQLAVQVGQPIEVGQTPQGQRRVIPITSGQVRGDGWSGRVLPGGADFQLIVSERLARLDARYVIETEAGERIYVENQAVRSAAPEAMQKLIRGEPVNPALIYFRCCPRLESDSPALAWINERMFFGLGQRHPDQVLMQFYELL